MKRTFPALALIIAATVLLLFSDRHSRTAGDGLTAEPSAREIPAPGKDMKRISLIYYAPSPLYEDAVRGIRDGLADAGFEEGRNLEFTVNHANLDRGILNQLIINEAGKKPDLLITLSTPVLQAVLQAVQDQNIVFGLVSAPLEAGAGEIGGSHRPGITGIAYLTPGPELMHWAKTLFPGARRLGTLYTAAESNSVKQLHDIREKALHAGMEVIAADVSSVSDVTESTATVLSRGADMFFISGSSVIQNGMPGIIKACRDAQIPVLANDNGIMGSGAVISAGPSPYKHGRDVAELCTRILRGADPDTIAIGSSSRYELAVDPLALEASGIHLPAALAAEGDIFRNLGTWRGGPALISLVNLVENPGLDAAIAGFLQGLGRAGLKEGRDFRIRKYSAQGEVARLPQILDAALMEDPDLVVTVTTPGMVAALKKVRETPLLFMVASDPFKIGALTVQPPNVTGIHDDPPVAEVLAMAARFVPELKTVGIIYDPSQDNSVLSVEKLRTAGRETGVKILETTISSVSDIDAAARSLIQRGAEAFILSTDNLVTTGFPMLVKAARGGNIPIFVTELDLVKQGADGGIGDDYRGWGLQASVLAVRILAGAEPGQMPIRPTEAVRTMEPR